MKISILQEKLKEGFGLIDKVSPKNFVLPVLKNVLLKTEKSFLKISATDLETGINWWGLAKVEEEGEVAVPGSLFSGLLSLLPDKQINISLKENNLLVESGSYKTRIKGVSPEDFPLIPKVEEKDCLVFDSQSFCRALSAVAEVASASSARPEIAGIYFYSQKNKVYFVATDSFRLAEKTLTAKKSSDSDKEAAFIIPKKTAKELISVFGDKKSDLRIYPSSSQVLFETLMAETNHPQIHFVSRLIEGEYPDYQEIVPKNLDTEAVFDKDEFLTRIKAASLFSGKVNEVKLSFKPKENLIEFSSQNQESGEFNSSLKGAIKGKPAEVFFDCRFLTEGLANIKSSEAFFGISGVSGEEVGPGVIRPVGDETYTYVVMPIRNG